MIPRHLTNRQRVILVVISVFLLGVGLFINLMFKLEGKTMRAPSSAVTGSVDALPRGTVHVGEREIPVEFALDPVAQERGLSYRDALPADEGMLFILPREEQQLFWMKGMRFPLDIIFIAGNRVVRVAEHIQPPDEGGIPALVPSGVAADKVLEINAGKAAAWGIEEGTEVLIQGLDRL